MFFHYLYKQQKMLMELKKCLECGTQIKGRIDKKFCTDYCRNGYNNKVNKESKNLIRNTNNRLRKNYKVLSNLNFTGKTKVRRTTLFDKGFDFNFFTSIYKTKTGNVYFYVYDQGYLSLENELFLLVKRED
jgi:predicted nucleic acid-binding Zn ribbon protein